MVRQSGLSESETSSFAVRDEVGDHAARRGSPEPIQDERQATGQKSSAENGGRER